MCYKNNIDKSNPKNHAKYIEIFMEKFQVIVLQVTMLV